MENNSIGAGAPRPNIPMQKASTAATTKQIKIADEGNEQLAQLMDECEQFMNRIDNDRVRRSMQDDAFAGQLMFEGGDDDVGMSAIPDEREDNVRQTDES